MATMRSEGLYNVNEFYSEHYMAEVLPRDLAEADHQGRDALTGLKGQYFAFLADLDKARDRGQRLDLHFAFGSDLAKRLGYQSSSCLWATDAGSALSDLVPALSSDVDLSRTDLNTRAHPRVLLLLAPTRGLGEEQGGSWENPLNAPLDPGLLARFDHQNLLANREFALADQSLEDYLNEHVFSLDRHPRYVLVVGIRDLILIDYSKWNEKRYLRFDLRELLDLSNTAALGFVGSLLCRHSLAPERGEGLLDQLDDKSHRHAAGVSEDLKYSLREAVELLGNEMIAQLGLDRVRSMENGEEQLTVQCLRYMYRLLFILYVEARPELEYAPMKSREYALGYSFESLRDLVEGPEPTAERDQKGTFFDTSIKGLFGLFQRGHVREQRRASSNGRGFVMEPLQSHLFDSELSPLLEEVVFPNRVLYQVIRLLSLNRPRGGARGRGRRGRISYVNLGINQLGAVYEALLSYRGFIATEDLFEVAPEKEALNKSELEVAYLVPRSRLADFTPDQRVRLRNSDDGSEAERWYPAGSFIYRQSGRDRQTSASYYTPEVLAKTLVSYSLKELLAGKSADEILDITVCEPAMGSAAFINEAVNQLADAYLLARQREQGETIGHDRYQSERQKVKSFLVDRNVYGVDLNPMARELGEVSLWLNSIHPGGFVPWLGYQLSWGNSLISARRQVYAIDQLKKGAGKPWHTSAPTALGWEGKALVHNSRSVFHFLLADPAMDSYKDKVVKTLAGEGIAALGAAFKGHLAPYSEAEIAALSKLSSAADRLWRSWASKLAGQRQGLTDKMDLYGHEDKTHGATDLNYKDNVYRHSVMGAAGQAASEYRRLKMAMDLWCALWFWDPAEAQLLPGRRHWLELLSALLTRGQVAIPDSAGLAVPEAKSQGELAFDGPPPYGSAAGAGDTDGGAATDTSPTAADELSIEDLGSLDLEALMAASPVLQRAAALARQLRFFHWELEFADIFARRGGFDLVLGNPPWIKLEWNEGAFMGDWEPAFVVNKHSAPQLATLRAGAFERYPGLEEAYIGAYCQMAGTKAFLNAPANYPALQGTQSNLYKCFLPLSWRLARPGGVQGFVHPEGVYDDPKGGRLRRELFPRLRYHFQFQNSTMLFPDVAHRELYSVNIYGPKKEIAFFTMANLFATQTIDQSFAHDGMGPVPGIKDEGGSWSLAGHRHRIVQVDAQALALFARLYDAEGTPAAEARLPALHARELVAVLEKFAAYPKRLAELEGQYMSLEMWHETNAQRDGLIVRDTGFPPGPDHAVISGPHFFVGNPCYKTPRAVCTEKGHYDVLDLTELPDDYLPRVNYRPALDGSGAISADYRRATPTTPWGTKVTEEYRVVLRGMLSIAGERTMTTALLPKGFAHTNAARSYSFENTESLLFALSGCYSVCFDFICKSTGKANLHQMLDDFPLLQSDSARAQLFPRALALSCLTSHYVGLWESAWDPAFARARWLKDDPRLDNGFWASLGPRWSRDCALRTDYERRQALVEVDVLVARELGLSLDELITLYRVQFPVLRQNEADTWYDRSGRIVFTCSKGLGTTGLARNAAGAKNYGDGYRLYDPAVNGEPQEHQALGWEDVQHLGPGAWVEKTYSDDTLPGGPRSKTLRYLAPFDRCQREEDYQSVWQALDSQGAS